MEIQRNNTILNIWFWPLCCVRSPLWSTNYAVGSFLWFASTVWFHFVSCTAWIGFLGQSHFWKVFFGILHCFFWPQSFLLVFFVSCTVRFGFFLATVIFKGCNQKRTNQTVESNHRKDPTAQLVDHSGDLTQHNGQNQIIWIVIFLWISM